MSETTRGRRPGPSTTHEEILAAARACLVEYGFDKSTLKKIADRAGVSDSLLIHQFGTREKLLVEAMDAPQGLDRALNLIRHLPKGTWGRVLAEAMARGEVRNKTGRENLELLVRAAAQSEVAAQMITEWVVNELTEEIRGLGINNPELRARGFATVLFGTTFSNEILSLPDLDTKQLREQVKLRGRVLQAILAD